MSQWFVYVLQCADGTFYTGITTDVEKRVLRHNAGAGARYTRSRCPAVLVWAEAVGALRAAQRREREIKGWPRDRKERLASETAPGV